MYLGCPLLHLVLLCLLALVNLLSSTAAEQEADRSEASMIDSLSAKTNSTVVISTSSTAAAIDKGIKSSQPRRADEERMDGANTPSKKERRKIARHKKAPKEHHAKNDVRDTSPRDVALRKRRRSHTHKNRHKHTKSHYDNLNHHHSSSQDYESTIKLTIPPKPLLIAMSNNAVMVRWKLPPIAPDCLPITFVKIQYREVVPKGSHSHYDHHSSKLWNTIDDDLAPDQTQYIVNKMKPGSTYIFRLAVVYSNMDNRHGVSSDKFTVGGLYRKTPRFAPSIVKLKALDGHSLNVTWQQSQESHIKIRGYYLEYKEYHNNNNNNNNNNRHINKPSKSTYHDYNAKETATKNGLYNRINIVRPQSLSYVIPHLRPKTQYSVRIRAYNKKGKSPFSNVVVMETLGLGEVASPSNLSLPHINVDTGGEEEEEEDDEEEEDYEEDEDEEDDEDEEVYENYYSDEEGKHEDEEGEEGDNAEDDFYYENYDDYQRLGDEYNEIYSYNLYDNNNVNNNKNNIKNNNGRKKPLLHSDRKNHQRGGSLHAGTFPHKATSHGQATYQEGSNAGISHNHKHHNHHHPANHASHLADLTLKDYASLKSERMMLIVACCVLCFFLLFISVIFALCLKKNYLLSIKLTKVPYKAPQNKPFNS